MGRVIDHGKQLFFSKHLYTVYCRKINKKGLFPFFRLPKINKKINKKIDK